MTSAATQPAKGPAGAPRKDHGLIVLVPALPVVTGVAADHRGGHGGAVRPVRLRLLCWPGGGLAWRGGGWRAGVRKCGYA
jgi:hypothetical protein